MSGTRSRRRGATGELEVASILRAAGWPGARRTADSRRQADRGDIDGGPTGYSIEVKRQERIAIWAALEQAARDASPGNVPILAFRRNHGHWIAALPLDHLLELLAAQEHRP